MNLWDLNNNFLNYFEVYTLISHQFESGFWKLFYFWNFHTKVDKLVLKCWSKYVMMDLMNLWHLNINCFKFDVHFNNFKWFVVKLIKFNFKMLWYYKEQCISISSLEQKNCFFLAPVKECIVENYNHFIWDQDMEDKVLSYVDQHISNNITRYLISNFFFFL